MIISICHQTKPSPPPRLFIKVEFTVRYSVMKAKGRNCQGDTGGYSNDDEIDEAVTSCERFIKKRFQLLLRLYTYIFPLLFLSITFNTFLQRLIFLIKKLILKINILPLACTVYKTKHIRI